MAIDVIMPQMGADMTEGTLVKWVKQVGDEVKRGDILAEIETDKATVELEAFDSGTLRRQVVEEGATVPVGEVIAILGSADEELPGSAEQKPRPAVAERKKEPATAAASQAAAAVGVAEQPAAAERLAEAPRATEMADRAAEPVESPIEAAPGVPPDGRIRISPVARRIAHDAGIEPAAVTGTGPDGRVLRRDVEAAIKTAAEKPAAATAAPVAQPQAAAALVDAPAPEPAGTAKPATPRPMGSPGDVVPLSRMRQAIARRMVMSKQQQPHYYLTLDVDMTAAMAFREQLNASASEQQRVSINDMIIKAVATSLERHPKFNAEFTAEGLKMHPAINVDIAIALDEGLIAPAILDCANKTLGRIAQESKDLVARAKSGHLRSDEYADGTFSITNLGAFGVETLIGIIKPPQAAILGVGSVMAQAVVRDGEIVARSMMKIALSADHRVSDGAEGARFIKEIQGLLENPVSLAL